MAFVYCYFLSLIAFHLSHFSHSCFLSSICLLSLLNSLFFSFLSSILCSPFLYCFRSPNSFFSLSIDPNSTDDKGLTPLLWLTKDGGRTAPITRKEGAEMRKTIRLLMLFRGVCLSCQPHPADLFMHMLASWKQSPPFPSISHPILLYPIPFLYLAPHIQSLTLPSRLFLTSSLPHPTPHPHTHPVTQLMSGPKIQDPWTPPCTAWRA